jgi:DNA-binding protein HU-beta
LSKKHIADSIQLATGVSASKANESAGVLLNHIIHTLKTTKQFALPGVGVLKLKETKARDARNPKTGETIKVPAGKTVRFRVSGILKDNL